MCKVYKNIIFNDGLLPIYLNNDKIDDLRSLIDQWVATSNIKPDIY